MRFEEWEPFYLRILDDFGFSKEADIESARQLNEILPENPPLDRLKGLLFGKTVNVFGAGTSLEKLSSLPGGISIAADGATSFFIERGIAPDVIVTDLDGKIEDLITANKKGSIIVVHGHGDNILALKYVKEFNSPIGTTQAEPFGKLHNFGGFTDGDRSVFLAAHFGAKEIRMFGMDFDDVVPGKYSFSTDRIMTKKKLQWAGKLINYLKDKGVDIISGVD